MSRVMGGQSKCRSLIEWICVLFIAVALLMLAAAAPLRAHADEIEPDADDAGMLEEMESRGNTALDGVTNYGSIKWGAEHTGLGDATYSFKLSYASVVSFSCSSIDFYNYSILDSNSVSVDRFGLSMYQSVSSFSKNHYVCLSPGSYTLKVTSGGTSAADYPFGFYAYHDDYDNGEYHGNTSSLRPYPIAIDTTYQSVKPINDKIHHYSVNVTKAGRYKLHGDTRFYLSKYREDNYEEGHWTLLGLDDWYRVIDLEPGTYYLRTSMARSDNTPLTGRYSFSLDFLESSSSGSSAAGSTTGDGSSSSQSGSSGSTVMYRLYNPNSGEHFYTANRAERDHLQSVGWSYEGHAWNAPKTGDAVYRMYNPNAGDHHYTTSRAERDSLMRSGWKYEGVGWYSDPAEKVPLYRLYNPHAVAGAHHYTTSAAERDHLKSVGWFDERIGWYGCS